MKFSQDVIEICQVLQDKKAEDIVVCNTQRLTNVADYFVIVTATSITHAKTLANTLEEFAFDKSFKVENREGFNYCDWIALDLDEMIVHIFTKQKREYYNLEKLLNEGNNIKSFDKLKKSIEKQERELEEKNKHAKIKELKAQKKEENKIVKKQQEKSKTEKEIKKR